MALKSSLVPKLPPAAPSVARWMRYSEMDEHVLVCFVFLNPAVALNHWVVFCSSSKSDDDTHCSPKAPSLFCVPKASTNSIPQMGKLRLTQASRAQLPPHPVSPWTQRILSLPIPPSECSAALVLVGLEVLVGQVGSAPG